MLDGKVWLLKPSWCRLVA